MKLECKCNCFIVRLIVYECFTRTHLEQVVATLDQHRHEACCCQLVVQFTLPDNSSNFHALIYLHK